MRLYPEVLLLGDNAMSRIRWTLNRETERLDTLRGEMPEVNALLLANGWSTRMLALGHIFNGLLDLAAFDDENGRGDSPAEETT